MKFLTTRAFRRYPLSTLRYRSCIAPLNTSLFNQYCIILEGVHLTERMRQTILRRLKPHIYE